MTAAVDFYGVTGGLAGFCITILVVFLGLGAAAFLKYLIR